jgi:hypothetical protein
MTAPERNVLINEIQAAKEAREPEAAALTTAPTH